MKGSELVFNYVHFFYYKCHKINPNCSGSYINSSHQIKSEKQIPSIKKITCFQYDVTAVLNHEEIKKRSAKNNKINLL